MKNFKFIYLIIVLILTIGCSSDNNDDNVVASPDQLILGNWIVTNMSISGNMTGSDVGNDWSWWFKYYPIPVQAFIENQDYTVDFSKSKEITSNGSIKTNYVAFVDDYINAYEYSKIIENVDVFKDGVWTLDGDFLTVSSNGKSEKYPITELTNNRFTILKHIKDYVVLNNEYGNIDCITNLDVYFTFQKN